MQSTHSVPTVPIDKIAPRWNLELVQRRAEEEFRSEFQSLPATWSLTFQTRPAHGAAAEKAQALSQAKLKQLANITPIMLQVGFTDDLDDHATNCSAWAALYGRSRNQVCYLRDLGKNSTYEKLVYSQVVCEVNFEEPFGDIGDDNIPPRAVLGVIRALVLTFWTDFEKACRWIARSQECPDVASDLLREVKKRSARVSHVSPHKPGNLNPVREHIKSEYKRTVDVQGKRAMSGMNMIEYLNSKRSKNDQSANLVPGKQFTSSATAQPTIPVVTADLAHVEEHAGAIESERAGLRLRIDVLSTDHNLPDSRNHSLTTQVHDLTTRNAESQTENESLAARVGVLQTQQDYDQNAYNSLKYKYEQLLHGDKSMKQTHEQLEAKHSDLEKRATAAETASKDHQRDLEKLQLRAQSAEGKLEKSMAGKQRLRQHLRKSLCELDQE
ncbi:hypothetical protein T440DRAFT_513823 [Plenodomus tracheiphilus IPT5]|uniref:Uncharacterized protein n=1 Tax=Plenodomus tracheiphilus IPT5 TaxID=1408161 RepID=A0A6A7BJQ6_9PLEO|nr:hypothetical protein T440DRAFT_513823 [Plenodomus tracheiphilus IPT5]